jgi:NAD(P)-dependent dehydrogenase (short-subunit alcohol dehydrogenase family)
MGEFLGLEGKVAVVTGGASGLGQAVARGLVREGARVVLGDIDKAGLERTAGELGEQVRWQRTTTSPPSSPGATRRSGPSRSWSPAPASSARPPSPR